MKGWRENLLDRAGDQPSDYLSSDVTGKKFSPTFSLSLFSCNFDDFPETSAEDEKKKSFRPLFCLRRFDCGRGRPTHPSLSLFPRSPFLLLGVNFERRQVLWRGGGALKRYLDLPSLGFLAYHSKVGFDCNSLNSLSDLRSSLLFLPFFRLLFYSPTCRFSTHSLPTPRAEKMGRRVREAEET